MSGLTATEAERLRSWALEITDTLLPDARHQDDGAERKYLGTGGLTINRRSGAWFSHSAGIGGYSIVALIAFLKKCGDEEAATWAKAWLAAHPGTGSCDGDAGGDTDDAAPASAAAARQVLDRIVGIEGTPAEVYLRSRRLDAPFPCCAFLQDSRCGEGALVGILTSHDRTVGVQLLYLDPDGRKSTVTPLRRRLMLETTTDAVFELQSGGKNAEVIICEGLEDALSVFRFGKRRCSVIGLPGIGTLQHLTFSKSTKVTVVRDGDAPGSAADKALQGGLDRLILAGCDVHTTARPPEGLDANAILQEAGVDGLVAFLDQVEPAGLSLHGEIEKLATLTQLDYARIRRREAKRFGIPVAILDDEVRKARDRLAAAPGDNEDDWADIEDTPVWMTPVDGIELLDELDKRIGEYVIMTREQRWCVALWVVFTHCFSVANNAPKLWLKSAERRSGKTRLVEVLRHLTARALASNYISAAMLPRVIAQHQPTLLLDEVDTFINSSEELRGVLNSGFDPESFVIIGTKVGDDWVPRRFSAWCPQALAGLGRLPETIADRCFAIELERKLREQKVSRLRRRDTGPLQILAQKVARWAEDNIDALAEAEPAMPALNDRAADAWELCVAIADRAGGHWPQRARQAAVQISGDEAPVEESRRIQLLSDIRDAFSSSRKAYRTPTDTVVSSEDLVDWLTGLEDRPWPEYRNGRPITKVQLARALKPFRVSPGTIRLPSQTTKGYKLTNLEKLFSRYLPPRRSVTPSQPAENREEQRDFETSQAPGCDVSETAANTSVSAGCDGVTVQNPPMGGKNEKNPGEGPVKGNGLDPSPPGNGGDPPPRKRYRTPGQVAEMLREIHRRHPDWSTKRIAKATGQPEERVRRALGNSTEEGAE